MRTYNFFQTQKITPVQQLMSIFKIESAEALLGYMPKSEYPTPTNFKSAK